MGTYLINFIVYSMAMVGLLFVCLMVYKKTMVNAKCTKNNNELSIENALNLNARKTLYVVKAGNEKFLIASDTERTTFLSKLNNTEKMTTIDVETVRPFKEELPAQSFSINQIQKTDENVLSQPDIQEKPQGVDYSEVMQILGSDTDKKPVMKEILRKLDERITTRE